MERTAKNPRLGDAFAFPGVEPDYYGDPRPQQSQWHHPFISDNFENNHQLINVFYPLPRQSFNEGAAGPSTTHVQKRSHQTAFFGENDLDHLAPLLAQQFPEFRPRMPSPKAGTIEPLDDENPFVSEDDTYILHPALQRTRNPVQTPGEVIVNAFIKAHFKIPVPEKKKELSQFPLKNHSHQVRNQAVRQFQSSDALETIPNLPPGFGDVEKFNNLDRELFKFFTKAVSAGRTVIDNDNTYVRQIAPMAKKPVVRHAILALAASYVLDYRQHEILEIRANFHHSKTVHLLSKELQERENRVPGKEDALIATLILLSHNECVNWEIDRKHEQFPKWYRAAKLAERILHSSDPAYNHHAPEHVQFTRARHEFANRVCLDSILSYCVYPFDQSPSKCNYPWLIRGTLKEKRKIIGLTGLSSLLMHYFAKITHLSWRRYNDPTSDVIPTVARAVEEVLNNFWQWSELSPGFATSEDLLNSCKLDGEGKVTTRAEVTDLVGESYVAAAQIYLQCRLFRRRRKDHIVQTILHRLLYTIKWQPTTGPLFTAQAPLFSVFIAGIVAYKPEDRDVIRDWVTPICSGSRGSVPPSWEAMQHIWSWLDKYDVYEVNDDSVIDLDDLPKVSLDNSDAWWEYMVKELSAKYGRLNLA